MAFLIFFTKKKKKEVKKHGIFGFVKGGWDQNRETNDEDPYIIMEWWESYVEGGRPRHRRQAFVFVLWSSRE